ncbi:MAG TPA: type IV secretion system DNA-binding domain-containing protein [Planktothrix sp.]|jgi:hypothetical protein
MNFEATLSEECRRYLRLFCQELDAGREGEQEWDFFAVNAHKMQRPPDLALLVDWLKQNLKTNADYEAIQQDYERVGRLLSIGDQAAQTDYLPESMRGRNLSLLMDMAMPAAPSGVPLGLHAGRSLSNGKNMHLPLSLPPEMRQDNPHILALGLQGKGKTGFMTRMIAHDIEAATRAVVVLDSDGTLIDFIDNWISSHPRAEEFVNRTIILDPSLETDALTYNALQVPDDGDVQSTATAVVNAFRARPFEPFEEQEWKTQTATILRNAVVLLACNGLTLADLPTVLLDAQYREVLLGHLEGKKEAHAGFQPLLDIWAHYNRLANSPQWLNWIDPILGRVTPGLSDNRILSIVNQRHSSLDLQQVLKGKMILLVRLPQDQLDHSGDLLASLIVSGLKRSAQSLIDEAGGRLQCALYVDYLDNLIGWDSVESILLDSKKHHIGFTGSAKSLNRLIKAKRSDLLNGFGTIAAFAVEHDDAEILAPRLLRLDPDRMRLYNLSAGDQERLNVERLTQQEPGRYFVCRIGHSAGIFDAQSPEYPFR